MPILRFDEASSGCGARASAAWRRPTRATAQRLERVTEELVNELRRRVGGTFTTDELARFYGDHGTDWCFDIATRVAPGNPEAWDLTTVVGAAFARYVREASDFAGGSRVARDN